MAALLELKGESSFQVRAYQKAADRLIEEEDLAAHLREGKNLEDLPGIGKTLADKIAHFISTGMIPQLEKLRREVPPGIVDMASLAGLGPGRVRKLREELQLESVEQLEGAIEAGKLESVRGFGEKTIRRLSLSIDQWKSNQGIRLHRIAREEGDEFLARVLEAGASACSVAGRLGRYYETVRAIHLIAGAADPGALLDSLASRHTDAKRQNDCLTFTGATGIPVHIAVVPAAQFGPARLWQTAGRAHRARLEEIAGGRGLRFDSSGLWRGDDPLPINDEESAYEALGLPFIPPECRECVDEIDLALSGSFPDLLEKPDIRGVLHNHSTWSDGKASIRDMAEHARALNYEYMGLADHSRTAGYAGGLSAERLTAQIEEVEKINREMAPFRIFHGIESDILKDGSLDYDDSLLERLDYVVASIHSRYGMDGPAITERLVSAAGNRMTTILGHPSGRLLTKRDPYDFDAEAVWDAAAENDTVIELNAHEQRLDVDWRSIPDVRARGLAISISPDAHTRKGLGDIDLAIHIARKGRLTRADVINTLDRDGMEDYLVKRRQR